MTIQEITVEKEIAFELKENGFPQDSYFYAIWNGLLKKYEYLNKDMGVFKDNESKISLPTAEELLKELPESIEYKGKMLYLNVNTLSRKHYLKYEYVDMCEPLYLTLNNEFGIKDKKLCNALAKYWLYLKKNNLLEETKSTKEGE
jgi:hypothetical protein